MTAVRVALRELPVGAGLVLGLTYHESRSLGLRVVIIVAMG